MECLLLRGSASSSRFGLSQTIRKTCPLASPNLSVRRYAFSPSRRRMSAHENPDFQDTTAGLDNSDPTQAHPLSGYYYDILSAHSPYQRQETASRPIPQQAEKPTPATTTKPQSPQDKMAIVFGTRLAGPGRVSRYDPGSIPPESQWKTINGVAIPPRPEEPDNCCMSGCVHCVWDDYRDEMEEWAGRIESAKAKGASKIKTKDMRQTPRAEVASASTSMDDDGGGRGTNWPLSGATEDLFADIPVGIREFMKTEKKLKQRHQQERANA